MLVPVTEEGTMAAAHDDHTGMHPPQAATSSTHTSGSRGGR